MLKFKRTSGGTYLATTSLNNTVVIEKHCESNDWIMTVRGACYNDIDGYFHIEPTKKTLVNMANKYNENGAI